MYAAKAPARRRANAAGISYPFTAPDVGVLEEPEDVVELPPYPYGLLFPELPVVVAVEPELLPPEVLLLPPLRVGVPPLLSSTPPNPSGTLGPLVEAELAALA
jgi:hypothetical protein